MRNKDGIEQLCSELNTFMHGLWQIEWCEQFRDLCEGTGEFATKVRASFYEERELPDEPTIPQEMVGDFAAYLRTYGF